MDDHFLISDALFEDAVRKLYVIHEVDNRSDHDPVISLIIHLAIDVNRTTIIPRKFASKPAMSFSITSRCLE
jgi:hypothetical protein